MSKIPKMTIDDYCSHCGDGRDEGGEMSDFYIKPIIDNDGYIESWILFKAGKLRSPVGIILDMNMEEIIMEVSRKKAEQDAIVERRKRAKK